jgi:hypothetical protein
MTEYSNFLDQLESTVPESPAPGGYGGLLDALEGEVGVTAVEAPVVPEPLDFSKMTYSENDLTKDDFYRPIEDYMVDRFGEHIRDLEREDVVEKFTNNMRGFTGGNSVRAINEITYLNEVTEDEERLAKAGAAYELYNGMQSMFGDVSWGESAEILWDFTRSAVVDPANVLSLGIGKAVSGAGFKAGSQVALISAKQAYKKKLAKEVAKGVTTEVAKKTAAETGEKILKRETAKRVAETNAKIATRQAAEKAATTFVQRVTTPTALKEAAAVGTFESLMSAGTDYLYQDAMLRTKVQEEYNTFQTGLSAVVGLVAGGIAGAMSNVGTGKSGLIAPEVLKGTPTAGSKSISKVMATPPAGATPSPPAGNWLKDIANGKELTDQDTDFFVTMLLGNDDKGLKGLAQILFEDGYVWRPRNPDDKVSNWIGDIIKQSDPQDAKQFLDDFEMVTGISMVDGKSLTIDAFADTFKKKMSDSGRVLNAASQASKLLGRNMTADEYAKFVLTGGLPPATSRVGTAGAKVGKAVGDYVNKGLPDLQNNIIRLMVSNLSTTALNVTGFAAATALNSASDMARAVLLGSGAGLMLAINPTSAKKMGLDAYNILQNQVSKARNTLDPNTTYDTFLQYSMARPEAMRPLTAVLPGGIESLEKLAKGFDPSKSLLSLRASQGVDFVQKVNLVSAQDGYTKAIEFTSQLDKFLRRSEKDGGFGMSYIEFMSKPDHALRMTSEKFVNLEAMAVNETLKAVFSKSYKGKDFVGEVAGIIEDARNLPGIGLLVPFGRFFNNTVAMSYETTAIGPLLSKVLGGQQDKLYGEIASKGLVTWSLIGMLALREQEFARMGLGWSEEIDPETGEVVDERYEFPYGAYKAIARIFAHRWNGDEIPKELAVQFGDQFFGQLTRQLGDAGEGLVSIAISALSDEGPGIGKMLQDAMGATVSQAISGATRPLEPVNALVGLSRDEEFYVPDRKIGNKYFNNSVRYMDQMLAAFDGGENWMPKSQSPVEGTPRVAVARLVSTTRASRLTNAERVMNSIGRPGWMIGMASNSEVADNRYNEVFHDIIESGSGKLWNSKRFKEGDLETKQLLVRKLLESSRKSTKAYMARVASNGDDRSLLKMIEISNSSDIAISRAMEDMGIDRPLEELSEAELDSLQKVLEFREEYLLRN